MSKSITVFCLLFFSVAAFAQNDRGTITGTVLDPANAVVPNANVVAINASGVEFKTVSTGTGNYTIPSLPAGVYKLTVDAAGFKKFAQENIQVQVSQSIRIDANLQVGSATDTVTITAEAPLLKTENAEQSTVVSTDMVNKLPLNFGGGGSSTGAVRDPFAFNILSPGVVQNTSLAGSDYVQINGIPASGFGMFRVQVEGQDATSSNDPNWTSTVSHGSVDMIQEFSLQTSNFAAEYGQAAGGYYNFTTKSGTNQIHGSAYEYLTNEDLDAYRPFTYTNPRSRKHDFGGTISGPVWIPKLYNGKNRTFFFFSEEVYRNNLYAGGSSYLTLPTSAMRSGNFAESFIYTGRNLGTDASGRAIMEGTIYDPASATTLAGGQVITNPFPGNIIPQTRFDPVAVKMQALIPATSNSAGTNNFAQYYLNYRRQQVPTLKIDEVLPDNSKLSFYFNKQTTNQLTSPDGLPYPVSGVRVQAIYGTTGRLNYDRSITPTMLLHLGAGVQRFHNPDSSPPDVLQYDAAGQLGFTGSATNPGGFPRIVFPTGMQSYGPSNANSYFDTTMNAVASATWVRGSHTYKTGAEMRLNSWTDRNSRGAQGILTLLGNETAMPYLQTASVGPGTIGNAYASFLLGQVDSATVNAIQDPQLRKKSWGLYLQDTWKVTRKLTLDYGLRWDLQSQGHEIHYRTSMFGPTIPNPTVNNLPGALVYEGYGQGRCNCQFTDTYPYALGPRLGVAYSLNQKTVIRGGIGLTYGYTQPYSYITNQSLLGVGFNTLYFTSPNFGTPAVTLSKGLQYSPSALTNASLNPGLVPNPGQINSPNYYIDRNGGRPPRIFQWSLSLQREVMPNLIVEAAWVGNRGAWESLSGYGGSLIPNMNAINPASFAKFGIDPTTTAGQTLLNSTFSSGTPQKNGFNLPYPTFPQTLTLAQALRPFPQFGNINVFWSPVGDSWYNSLQVKATRRFSKGLAVTSAFTWSKAESNPAGTVNNIFNRAVNKSISSFDEPFIFSVGYTYELQKYTQSKLVNTVVAGWAFGGLMAYASGLPIASPTSSNTMSNWYFQNTLENRVPGVPLFNKDLNCHCVNPYSDFVLNPAAWANPAPGTWGTASPYYSDYRYERRPNEQMNIARRFHIRERMSLEVRAEFFNIFNRTYLANPTVTGPQGSLVRSNAGNTVSGFGYINPTSLYTQPRNGQLVARFQF